MIRVVSVDIVGKNRLCNDIAFSYYELRVTMMVGVVGYAEQSYAEQRTAFFRDRSVSVC